MGGYPAQVSPDPPGSIEDPFPSPDDPPGSIQHLARQRAAARSRRDWADADRLRAEIESAGWKVIDQGVDFSLEPALAPDVVDDGRVHYGSSASVPSRLDEPISALVSVVLIAPDRPEALAQAMAPLGEDSRTGGTLVIVANAPDAEVAGALADIETAGLGEVLWLAQRLAPAAAANAGLRRASGSLIVLLDEHARPTGDVVTPLSEALADPSVAVAGAIGLGSSDMRRWAPTGPGPVDALAWGALAFRREDLIARGPLDERFHQRRSLGPWWSLVLRDEGPATPPRRALAVALPLEPTSEAEVDEPSLARASKRDFYRLIDRFGHRYDLLDSPAPRGRAAERAR